MHAGLLEMTINLDHYMVMSIIRVNLHEAKARLSHYLNRVQKGETVVICRRNVPVAELSPVTAAGGGLRLGVAAGEFLVPDAFLEPLPEDVLDDFEGRGS